MNNVGGGVLTLARGVEMPDIENLNFCNSICFPGVIFAVLYLKYNIKPNSVPFCVFRLIPSGTAVNIGDDSSTTRPTRHLEFK